MCYCQLVVAFIERWSLDTSNRFLHQGTGYKIFFVCSSFSLRVKILRVLSTLVAMEWKSTIMLVSQFLIATSSRIQYDHVYRLLKIF